MLDVSVRASILSLLHDLRRREGMAILMITHDLSTAAHFADRIAVMYLGRIVELGPPAASSPTRGTRTTRRYSRSCRNAIRAIARHPTFSEERRPIRSRFLRDAVSIHVVRSRYPNVRRAIPACGRPRRIMRLPASSSPRSPSRYPNVRRAIPACGRPWRIMRLPASSSPRSPRPSLTPDRRSRLRQRSSSRAPRRSGDSRLRRYCGPRQ
jgi:hypothetical protein